MPAGPDGWREIEVAMSAFTNDLHARGLAFVDDGSAARRGGGIPRASADRVIDDELAGDAIDKIGGVLSVPRKSDAGLIRA